MNYYKCKISINLGAICLALVLIFCFIVLPAVKDIRDIRIVIEQKKAELEQKLALGLNIKKIRKDLADIESSLGDLDQIFVKSGQEVALIAQLESLAAREGVDLSAVSDFTGKKINASFKQIPLQLNLKGTLSQNMAFMKKLEKLPFYYNPDAITVSREKQSSLTAQIIGKIYLTEND